MIAKKYSLLKVLTLIIIVILSVSVLLFTYLYHSEYVRADQWRFLELYIIPIYQNSFHVASLWIDHHPQPLTALLFIISAEYFHLSINLFSYIGIFSKIIFFIFFLYLLNTSITTWQQKSQSLLMIVVASIFFSLKSINEYHWGLVTLSNFWFLVLLGMYFYMDRALKYNVYKNGIVFGLLVLCLLIGAKDFATIGLLGSAIFLLVLLLFSDKRKKAIILFLILAVSFLLFKIFWAYLNVEPQHVSKLLFDFNSLNILGALRSLAAALLSGFVNISMLQAYGVSDTYILLTGYMVLAAYMYILFAYLKDKLFDTNSIPLLLILYLFLFIVAIFLFRFFPIGSEIDWRLASPRYTKVYEIGAIALIWAYAILFNKKKRSNFFTCILYIFGIILFILNILSVFKAWDFSKYLVSTNTKIEKSLLECFENNETCDNLPKWLTGGSFTQEKILFLQKNQLNVFYKRGNE